MNLPHGSLPKRSACRSGETALIQLRLKPLLYLICLLADFSGFMVVFAVTRQLAEQHAPLWYLGLAGAVFAGSSGAANVIGGLVAHRVNDRAVFLFGAVVMVLAVALCASGDPGARLFLLRYALLGIGLGCIYPTLIGWLSADQDAHADRRGVSRTLILYCISWNLGMMCGQLVSGSLFLKGLSRLYAVAGGTAGINIVLALLAVGIVSRRSPRRADGSSSVPAESPSPTADGLWTTALRFRRLSWIANLGGTFGGSLIFHLLPDLAVSLGMASDSHGSLLAWWRGVVIATYGAMHVFGFWHYRLAASVASQLLGVAGLLLIAAAPSAGWLPEGIPSSVLLLLGVTLHGQLVGYNYFSGLFYSTAGSVRSGRTLAAGIHEATLAVGMAAGTLTGGVLGSTLGKSTPWLLAAAVLSGLLLLQAAAWMSWLHGDLRSAAAAGRRTVCEEGASS